MVTSIQVETRTVESRAQIFAALSDPIRLRILDALGDDQHCACDLQDSLEIAPNLLSYHLRVLREAGLVEGSRRGRWVDYRLTGDAPRSVTTALPSGVIAGVMS